MKKQLGIREIRKTLVGKTYHTAHLREDDSRDFEEWRHLEHVISHKLVRIDKMEIDPFENSEEQYGFYATNEEGDMQPFSSSDIEELVTKGYIFEEHSYGISDIPTTYSLCWVEGECPGNTLSIHTVFNHYVRNVMLGTLNTYEFAIKLAKKFDVSLEYVYHFIDKDNDFDCAVKHFDWEGQDDYLERLDEFRLD